MVQRKPLSPEREATIPRVNVDDMLTGVKYYVDEEFAHLWIEDPALCRRCEAQSCLYICPAGVYRIDRNGTIIVSYQACLECGSCRIACPQGNIGWSFPRGGYGVAYKFG